MFKFFFGNFQFFKRSCFLIVIYLIIFIFFLQPKQTEPAIRKNNKTDKAVFTDEQKIFVSNLRRWMTEETFKEHFKELGVAVVHVEIKQSRDARPNFGFITFEDAETTRHVLNELVSVKLFTHITFYMLLGNLKRLNFNTKKFNFLTV